METVIPLEQMADVSLNEFLAWFSKSGLGFTKKGNNRWGKERIFSTSTIRFFLNPL